MFRGRGLDVLGLLGALAGCGDGGQLIALGDLPPEAQSFVLALEQDEARAIYAHPASGEPLRIGFPFGFSDQQPISLTRLALRETLAELGLTESGLLPASAAPRRGLGTLGPLVIENASVSATDSSSKFEVGTASDWILQHPVPRLDRCLQRVSDVPIVESRPPRDLMQARADLAVGLSLGAIHLFDLEGAVRSHPIPLDESGHAIGLGVAGRIWIATSSRAGVLDEASGELREGFAFPPAVFPIGIAEDPARGDLYVFSATERAEVWRRRSGAADLELFYVVPPGLVRIAGLQKQSARFIFSAPGRLAIAIDDVAAVIEIQDDTVTLLLADSVGSGFSGVLVEPGGRVLLAEAALGDLYEYRPGQLEKVADITTKVVGIAPLTPGTQRYVFVTSSALLGTFDLGLGEDCEERPVASWGGAYGLLRFGDRLIAGGNVAADTWGFRFLELQE